jgi:hypothetical protein
MDLEFRKMISINSNITMDDVISLVLTNFGLAMFAISVFFILLHKLIVGKKVCTEEIVYRWLALFPLGITMIYCFVIHVFYPDLSTSTIGWKPSPFQYEVGMADLAIGVIAILSFNASLGFRLATVIVSMIFLFGCASQHIHQMIIDNNYLSGNAGSWLWFDDLVLPLLLFLCINGMRRANKA